MQETSQRRKLGLWMTKMGRWQRSSVRFFASVFILESVWGMYVLKPQPQTSGRVFEELSQIEVMRENSSFIRHIENQ